MYIFGLYSMIKTMDINKKLTTIVNKQRHPKKPILYWVASNGDWNYSIAILKAKYGKTVKYKPIR